MTERKEPVRVAVLVSGGGTNLQALLDALHDSPIARIARVISSRPDAGDPAEVLSALAGAQLVVLAGYLKLVHASVVARFRGRIINIHPALLPDFGGAGMYGRRVHEAVLASGAKESGATVHFVEEEFDRGAIIAQEKVRIESGDTPDTLAARVLEAEHRLLPRVVLELARRIV